MIGIVSALRILGGGLHQYGFTVFFLPVTNELGLSRAATSLAFSLARAQGSFASPLVGYLVDRYGPKRMMITAAFLAGVGYILDLKSTRLNSSHPSISYAVFCLKKKTTLR